MLGLGGAFLILHFRDRGWHPAGAFAAAIAFAFGGCRRLAHAACRPDSEPRFLADRLFLPVAGARARLRALRDPRRARRRRHGARTRPGRLSRASGSSTGVVAASWSQAQEPLAAARRSFLPLAAGAFCGALVIAVPIGLTLFLAESSNRPDIAIRRGGARLDPSFPAPYLGHPEPLRRRRALQRLLGRAEPPLGRERSRPRAQHGRPLSRRPAVRAPRRGRRSRACCGRARSRYFTIAFVAMLLYALGGATPVFRLAFEALPGDRLLPASGRCRILRRRNRAASSPAISFIACSPGPSCAMARPGVWARS